MKCPVCALEMIVVEREGIEVDYCVSCRGLWFDAGEVELLAEKLDCTISLEEVGRPAATAERPRDCPRCDRRMEKIDLEGGRVVTVDRCVNGHGLWFDAGEVGALMRSREETGGAARPIVSFLGETVSGGRT